MGNIADRCCDRAILLEKRRSLLPRTKKILRESVYVPSTPYRRETTEYKSAPLTPYREVGVAEYKKEESKKYTLAPAYNKGAYQVISKENIRDIGK